MACNNIRNVLRTFIFLAGAAHFSLAQADLLDTLKSTTDLIKKTGILEPSTPATPKQPNASEVKSALPGASQSYEVSEDLPLGLIEYPRSTLTKQINNPFDQVVIPISPPKRGNGDEWRARYNVPAEGKVTMLYFEHQYDDSPLLIQNHYESWLESNGFERLMVCKSPCKEADTIYWYFLLDPKKLMTPYPYPKDATYIVGYKPSGIVLVSVGRLGNDKYGSYLKIVEGQVTDNSDWLKRTSPATLPPPVEPSKPSPVTPTRSGVKAISGADAVNYVKQAKGVTFVQVSSYDKNCSYCARANPEYEAFSYRYASKAVFLQITAQPWKDAFNNDFARQYNITSVPTTLVFKDGTLMRQWAGFATADELDQKLVK